MNPYTGVDITQTPVVIEQINEIEKTLASHGFQLILNHFRLQRRVAAIRGGFCASSQDLRGINCIPETAAVSFEQARELEIVINALTSLKPESIIAAITIK
jgi:hypothetical protein